MATWITPKTDWVKTDSFTYTDYNRIKNNLTYLNDLFNSLAPDKAIEFDFGEDYTYANNYDVDIFNMFEECLQSFTRIGSDVNIGEFKVHRGNSQFLDYDDLNRIEKCCVNWYSSAFVSVKSVNVSPATFDIYLNTTFQLTATVLPENAYNKNVIWSSSNNTIATVDENGLVTALKKGSVRITCRTVDGDKRSTAQGTITKAVASDFEFYPTSVSVNGLGVCGYVYLLVDPPFATDGPSLELSNISTFRILSDLKTNLRRIIGLCGIRNNPSVDVTIDDITKALPITLPSSIGFPSSDSNNPIDAYEESRIFVPLNRYAFIYFYLNTAKTSKATNDIWDVLDSSIVTISSLSGGGCRVYGKSVGNTLLKVEYNNFSVGVLAVTYVPPVGILLDSATATVSVNEGHAFRFTATNDDAFLGCACRNITNTSYVSGASYSHLSSSYYENYYNISISASASGTWRFTVDFLLSNGNTRTFALTLIVR